MKIREAVKTDINKIIEFQILLARETEDLELDKEILTKGVKSVFNDSSKAKYYVCEVDGEVIGCYMTTFEWSDWGNAKLLWLQSVYILKDHRSKGAFKRFFTFLKELVLNSDEYRGIRLYVNKSNLPAIKAYTKLGMNGDHYHLFEWMKN